MICDKVKLIVWNGSDKMVMNFFKDFIRNGEIEFTNFNMNEIIHKFIESKTENGQCNKFSIELYDEIDESYDLIESFYCATQAFVKKNKKINMKSYITFGDDTGKIYYIYAVSSDNKEVKIYHYQLEGDECKFKMVSRVAILISKSEFIESNMRRLILNINKSMHNVENQIIYNIDELNDEVIFSEIDLLAYKDIKEKFQQKVEQLICDVRDEKIVPVRRYEYCAALQDYLMEYEDLEESIENEDLFDENIFSLYSKVESEILNRIFSYMNDKGMEYTSDEVEELEIDEIVEFINKVL